jgi:hypothetical protein
MKTLVGAILELSGGNIRNHHFYLHGIPWLPKEVIGGTSAQDTAKEVLEVTFSNVKSNHTDLAGDKMIFRERAAVREFFEDINATEGTRITIEKTGPRSIHVAPK